MECRDDRAERSKAEERNCAALELELIELRRWLNFGRLKQDFVPRDWHRIEREVPVRARKTRITAGFDADLVKWFRAMGHGYQARMNAVLRAYMLAVVSKEILRRADIDWKGDPI